MPGDDPLGPVLPPRPATLSDQLLLQALSEMSEVKQALSRLDTQTDTILQGQQRIEERQAAAELSRGKTHDRINEISVNVAELAVGQEQQDKRLDALDPIVTTLRDAHIEGRVIRKVIVAVAKNGYVRGAGAAIAGGAAWHQWDNLVAAVRHAFRFKVGGP